MKLKSYVKHLNELLEKYPEAKEYDVVYSIDDEGNAYFNVGFPPSLGIYVDGSFILLDNLDEYDYTVDDVNAVCVN